MGTEGWYSTLWIRVITQMCAVQCNKPIGGVKRFKRALDLCHWKVAISIAWRQKWEHINALEMEPTLLAVRHMCRSCITAGSGVRILIDNTVLSIRILICGSKNGGDLRSWSHSQRKVIIKAPKSHLSETCSIGTET